MTTISKKQAGAEVAALVLLFFAVKIPLVGLDLGFFTPGAIFVLSSLALIWFLQKRRGSSFAGLGLKKPESWKRSALIFFGTLALTFVVAVGAIPYLQEIINTPEAPIIPPGTTIPVFLIWARVMVTAAFGEEVIFRGFLLGRFEALFGYANYALPMAVVLQALLFGLAHYSSGAITVIAAGIIGLIFGGFFILGKRNLWPMMLAHAIPDSISIFQG